MNDRDLSRLLRWYPSTWRDRYEGEIVVFMKDAYGDRPPPRRERLSLAVGGLRERARQSGLTGDSAPVADRVRAGASRSRPSCPSSSGRTISPVNSETAACPSTAHCFSAGPR
jgi:hypothetical protein